MTTPPLAGLRVVDFSEAVPGPFFTHCLADLGADVTKVERPQRDITFNLQPAVWHALNGAKSVHILDLKNEDDKNKALELIEAADVMVEGFRPGVMDRLGLGYAELADRRPDLIYVSLSGFGQEGPYADVPGHDLNYLAASGLLAISGDRVPANAVGAPIGDLASSMYAVTATLAAYVQRQTTGRGQHLDVSIADCLTHWMNTVAPNLRARGRATVDESRALTLAKPAYGAFETAEGDWIAVAALEDKFWRALADELGLDADLLTATRAERTAASSEINDMIGAAVALLGTAEVLRRLRDRDVPVALVESPVTVAAAENSRVRGLFEERSGTIVARFPVRLAGLDGTES
ncbi:CoA transferase [Nocardia sp. R6R-6]|uniref:CoA transferase n=1 Tax=Nocardia sp. R6R-6 TaxID=3459303 RepID=UPI00403DE874